MTPLGLVSVDGVALKAVVHEHAGARALGAVVMSHGITADMDEGGMFVRLADRLSAAGFDVLRFSFRGHRCSGGTQRGVTVAGEMLDLQAAVDAAVGRFTGGLSVVAASFGAVPLALLLPYLDAVLTGVALWNPVLDLRRTFVEPELAWGLENFGPEQRKRLSSDGFLVIDGEFELGRVLWEELSTYRPVDRFLASSIPALVVHGDRDSYVSYEVAREAAARRGCEFHTVAGSDHGFNSREREDEAIGVTVDWLVRLHAGAA